MPMGHAACVQRLHLMTPADYNVLIVDDDTAMLRLTSKWLERAGYTVRVAADGHEALAAIGRKCPDFLITDWEMPQLDGLELCRKLREMSLPHYVYVIFLTVKKDVAEMIAGLENGADDFLAKPISEGELLARMQSSSRVLELERRLSLMAHTDSLTGLSTQRMFYECLEKEWQRSERSGSPLSCVMMDLDYFKQVNDVHGHQVGDSVLKCVAELLENNCRVSDIVCRYGGEEFCALLPETSEKDAVVWAERAQKRLASLGAPTGIEGLRVAMSFGVAQRRDDTQTSEKLVDLADQALLCAKRMGRDRIICYTSLIETAKPNWQSLNQYDDIFGSVHAKNVMSPLGVCLRESDSLDKAAQFFLQSGTPSTPILNADGMLAGILSEKDLMTAMISPERWQQPISGVMGLKVIHYEEDTPVRLIYEFLCRLSIRSVVITKNGRPTGTISRGSLLRCFRDWFIRRGSGHSPTPVAFLPEDSTTDTASARFPRSLDNA